ncbi:MAG: NPCBM/NEW2 domain-containing protein [Planctomycetes bacterium]|nr:NPCBM/NEW2 domain-containing protein [Planctomycetota bacterium]
MALTGLTALLPATLRAQAPFEVALRDGRVLAASALAGDRQQGFEVQVEGAPRRLAAADLLAVHGAPVQPVDLPAAWFADGDVVHGAIVGGDAAGDRIELQSPVFGRIELPIERLAAIAAAAVREPLRLRLPEGVGEALFLRAAVGFDIAAGALHRCGDRGLAFTADGSAEPRWYGPSAFVALRIADPAPRRAAAAAWLATRTGDRLGVSLRRWSVGAVQAELDDGGVVELRPADVACLVFADAGIFLSDLEPIEVAESGVDAEVLHPWRRDRSALGGPLTVAGRTHGKGLGVHSRSRLVFRAPAGAEHFWTRVGLDDSSAALGIAAEAEVRVLVDGAVRFEQRALRAGPPRDTGLLPVRPGQTVALEVDCGRGRDLGDRVDWLSPVFLPAPGRRP